MTGILSRFTGRYGELITLHPKWCRSVYLAKQYAVMDMMGHVISVGELNEGSALVTVPTRGAYVVRVGLGYQRVNVK